MWTFLVFGLVLGLKIEEASIGSKLEYKIEDVENEHNDCGEAREKENVCLGICLGIMKCCKELRKILVRLASVKWVYVL